MRNWRRAGGLGPGEPILVLEVSSSIPTANDDTIWTFSRPLTLQGNVPQFECQDIGDVWMASVSWSQLTATTIQVTFNSTVEPFKGWRVLLQPAGIPERFALPQSGEVL